MAFTAINPDTADQLIGALCNTLVHSLWQGVLLAAAAGLIVVFTKKASSALRYNLLVLASLSFAIGVAVTFAVQMQLHVVKPAVAPTTQVFSQNYLLDIQPSPAPVTRQPFSFTSALTHYLNAYHNTIVLIWFLIVCARSIQLSAGLYGTYRLKRVKVMSAGRYWEDRMSRLSEMLGIRQTVILLESALAKVPMVIGNLKPVVLIPIGLLTALSEAEVEAILVHELAHIRRRDYLVNLLQSLMEIVFFFNPAVLWISQLIKTERENCCDDLVLQHSSSKQNYIQALVSCQQYPSAVPPYAVAFPGGKSSLLDRVKRMATNRNHSLNMFEKTMLAVCLVVLGLGISAFTVREEIKKTIHAVVAAIHHESPKQKAKSDTTKKKQTEPADNVNALLNNLQLLHPDTLTATGSHALDGLVRNVDSLSLKRANDLLLGSKAQQFDIRASKDLLANLSRSKNGLINPNSTLALLGKGDSDLVAKFMAKHKPLYDAMHGITQELYREHLVTDTSHMNITLNERELIVNGTKLPDNVHERIYAKYGKDFGGGNYSGDYTDNNTTLASDDKIRFASDDKTNEIISDMMKDGIITSTDDLSFKIGTTEFVVNYKKQPEALYQKYRAKYVPGHPKGDWIWFYHFDTNKWDQMSGHKSDGDFHGTASGVFQGKEDANASGYNSRGNYHNRWDAYADSVRDERNRVEAERDKKVLADLIQDGLITDTKNVSFSLSDKGLKVNGKKQSDDLYKKYKDKYMPNNTGSGWNWSYTNHQ